MRMNRDADSHINDAGENNKKVIGHVLVWHQQTPECS